MTTIYHLTNKTDWETAQPSGEYEAPSLADEGFIHCSKDVPQLLKVAARLYQGRTDLQVLDLDLEKLDSLVKYEPSRSGEVYPHIYGKLNLDAVVRVRNLGVDSRGQHVLEE
jgi:uncharacterized protein (DUF952 family)